VAETVTSNTIPFLVTPGNSYPYSVGSISCFSDTPTSGNLPASASSPSTKDVAFAETCSYSASFSEAGLPSTDSWSVSVGQGYASGAAGSTLTVSGLTGSNTYSVSPVVVSSSCTSTTCTVHEYEASSASGVVTYGTHISETFSLRVVTYHI